MSARGFTAEASIYTVIRHYCTGEDSRPVNRSARNCYVAFSSSNSFTWPNISESASANQCNYCPTEDGKGFPGTL